MFEQVDGSRWQPGRLWRATLSSVLFLSRLPISFLSNDNKALSFDQTSHTFPLAGIIVALPAAAVLLVLSSMGLPAIVSALLTVTTMVLVTGALHEDGLADLADGFWGGHSKERKLAIMRDSAIGTYGVLALVLSVGLRITVLSALLSHIGPTGTVMLFIAFGSCSRLAILGPWTALNPARIETAIEPGIKEEEKPAEGVSIRFGAPTHQNCQIALILGLPAILVIFLTTGLIPLISAVICGCFCTWGIMALARKHIGGHTGDVLGATQQIAELGLYLGLLVAI